MQETRYVITPFALGVNRRHHSITDVSSGSLADVAATLPNVRFTPESGRQRRPSPCPLCARSGCEQSQQTTCANAHLFDHLVDVPQRHSNTKLSVVSPWVPKRVRVCVPFTQPEMPADAATWRALSTFARTNPVNSSGALDLASAP